MGPFVLGVLVGWLAEWLFYTFWVKAGDNNEDCSAIKAELDLKNRQISSLQTQLASLTESSSSATKASTASTSTANTAVKKNAKAAGSTTSSKAKTTAKSSAKSATKAKPSKPAAVKTTKPKATSADKKATPAKRKAKAGGDDFTKLSGIGPSMSATLKSLGIDTFQKLASTDDDILRDMLEQSGARMNNNKDDMDSWNEQATVAATGDFKALKAMQVELKK